MKKYLAPKLVEEKLSNVDVITASGVVPPQEDVLQEIDNINTQFANLF